VGAEVEGESDASKFVDDHVNEGRDELPEGRPFGFDLAQKVKENVQGVVVAEVKDLLLALEIVVEAPLGHVEFARDLLDAGPMIAAAAKRGRRTLKDLDAPLASAISKGGIGRHVSTGARAA